MLLAHCHHSCCVVEPTNPSPVHVQVASVSPVTHYTLPPRATLGAARASAGAVAAATAAVKAAKAGRVVRPAKATIFNGVQPARSCQDIIA